MAFFQDILGPGGKTGLPLPGYQQSPGYGSGVYSMPNPGLALVESQATVGKLQTQDTIM